MEKKTAISNLSTAQSEFHVTESARDMAVLAAREAGASWAEVATQLGMSRQAAQQRYGSPEAADRIQRRAAAIARGKAEAEAFLTDLRQRHHTAEAVARATDNHAQHVEATATFLNGTEPAKPAKASRKVAPKAPATATDNRPCFKLESAGKINGVAQPGTGKGPHACPRCGCTNHKGADDQVRAYFDCTPTKYDPQDIADYLNSTGLRHKAQ